MIQLIEELKLQAGIEDNPDQEGLDVFAKLIIENCLTILVANALLSLPLSQADKDIRRAFGIEE